MSWLTNSTVVPRLYPGKCGHALGLESHIAYSQCFVHNHDVCSDMSVHRKGQAAPTFRWNRS